LVTPWRDDDVSTDDLRLLLTLSRTGRMVAVAAVLGIDHTTVRRRLRRLESSLGTKLIEQGSDGWVLTDVGRAVAERSTPLEHVVQRVRDAVTGVDGTVRGTVRIFAPDGFGVSFVTAAVSDVVDRHPEITVELVTATRPLSPRASGYDLSISIGPPRSGWVHAELLAPYALGLYASHSYLACHPAIASAGDLADHRLVFYVDSHLTVAELDLARRFSGMRVGLSCTNVSAQVEATKHGAGIGLLPCFMAAAEPDLAAVLPDQVRFLLDYTLSLRRDSIAGEAVRLVRAALRQEIARRRQELVPPL
jgi:DNA-binding transcriptional LysR family regulator